MKMTLTLAAQAMLSAHAASTYCSRTNFNADPPRLGLTCIDAEDSTAAGGTETLSTKKVDDAAALGTGEVKAAIGDPTNGQASQLG